MYRFRDVLLEDVPVQWSKKCVGYEETKEGVLVLFKDRSREFCDILVGADGVNSPGKENILNIFYSPFFIFNWIYVFYIHLLLVRKQKLHELQIFDYGATLINAEVAVPKSVMK